MAINLKNKIETIEKAKKQKIVELKQLYNSLTGNEENLDMLMIQLGREIERIFPNLKFILISRIKSTQSFEEKIENALNKCEDIKSIRDIQIYDIIGLNIIVEEVPNDLMLDTFRKSQSFNKDFESNILYYILRKKTVESDMNRCKSDDKASKENLKKLKEQIERKKNKLFKLDERLKYVKEEKIESEILEDINETKQDIKNYNMQIKHLNRILNTHNEILRHGKILDKIQKNECNNEMAKFIIRKLTQFEGIKLLGLKSIKNRFKIIEKDNGYRSTHDSYEMTIREKEKKIRYRCEIQGKSVEAYYESYQGKAAKYHIQPDPKPGKKLKNKNLPDILSVNTPEEKKEFINKVNKTVPRFRIYRNNNGNSEIYKLSLRECYMFYYHNQLFGNEILNIKKQNKQVVEVTETDLLKDDGKIYTNNLEYKEL